MKKQIKTALRINFYAAVLLLTLILLYFMILVGGLFKIEAFLYSLFYINCFIVAIKFFNK